MFFVNSNFFLWQFIICLAAVILVLPTYQNTLYDNMSLQFYIKITVQNIFNFVCDYMAIPDFQGMNWKISYFAFG